MAALLRRCPIHHLGVFLPPSVLCGKSHILIYDLRYTLGLIPLTKTCCSLPPVRIHRFRKVHIVPGTPQYCLFSLSKREKAMNSAIRWWIIVAVLSVGFWSPQSSGPRTRDFASFQFSFSPPGARSSGMAVLL